MFNLLVCADIKACTQCTAIDAIQYVHIGPTVHVFASGVGDALDRILVKCYLVCIITSVYVYLRCS